MIKLKGYGVSAGIAVGKVKIRKVKQIDVKEQYISEKDTRGEMLRFKENIDILVAEIEQIAENFAYSKVDKDILTTHRLILQDPEFSKNIFYLISNELMTLEYAVHKHFNELIDLFHKMDNEYFAQRASDYEDVALKLLHQLRGTSECIEEGLNESSILVMQDIIPSYVSRVAEKGIRGLCLSKGSLASHATIIARSINLVTVVGTDRLLEIVHEDDILIMDGNTGDVIINPDDDTMAAYRDLIIQEEIDREALQSYINKKTMTADGQEVRLYNNIEYPEEVDILLKNKSEGVGLFRTEFLYIDRHQAPSEDEQFEIYKKVCTAMVNYPVIIRTIDIGGDKLSKTFNMGKENNPYLGLRGIRLSLKHPDLLKSQFRAILRASHFGKLSIMLPLVSSIDELRKSKVILAECKQSLKRRGIPFDPDIKLGIMIEVPSAALLSDLLAQECDFFSIGTNDLVQYTLAADRDSETVIEYYEPCNPAVLKLIKMTVDNAKAHNIPVGICGEIASSEQFIPFLIGLGIDSLSVNPGASLTIKKTIAGCNSQAAQQLVAKVLTLKTSDEIKSLLRGD